MANVFTYIPPRQVSANPFVEGVGSLLEVYNNFNAQKKQNQQDRMKTILSMADKADFAKTISVANKTSQMGHYNQMMKTLTDIVKSGVKKDGSLSMEDMTKSQEALMTFGTEIASITQEEAAFHKDQAEYVRNSKDYDPRDVIEYTNNYINSGVRTPIKKKPIMPDQWMSSDLKSRAPIAKPISDYGDGFYTIENQYVNSPEEREKLWLERLGSDERKMDGLNRTWETFKQKKPKEANKYLQGNDGDDNSAAMMFGVNELAPNYLPNVPIDRRERQRAGKSDGPIKMTKRQDGSYSWIVGGVGKPFSGKVTTIEGKDVDLVNAKVSEVVYDPNTGNGVIGYTSYVNEPTSQKFTVDGKEYEFGGTGTTKTPKTYYVPYDKYSSFVKNNFALEGLNDIEKSSPKRVKTKSDDPLNLFK